MAYGVGGMARKATVAVALAAWAGAAAAETRILALGDSLTAGYGLPEGDGFVPVLQRWLDENGVDATVVNAGVSGDTTAGGRARLDWALAEPMDAAIVALGGNDLLRGLSPDVSRENLGAIMDRMRAEGMPVLLVGIEAPGNYGPAYKAAFDGMYVDLGEDYGAMVEPSFLGPLIEGTDVGTARARYMQADGIHPNAEGVARIVEAFGPRVADLVERAAGS